MATDLLLVPLWGLAAVPDRLALFEGHACLLIEDMALRCWLICCWFFGQRVLRLRHKVLLSWLETTEKPHCEALCMRELERCAHTQKPRNVACTQRAASIGCVCVYLDHERIV
jgi:hypothetical protein